MNLNTIRLLREIEAFTKGELFLVGGCVRDELMGNDAKDVDVLVRNVEVQRLVHCLHAFGKVDQVGATFGVIRLIPKDGGPDIELALPREEVSTGDGHKDFVVDFDPVIPVEDDLRRRDFTVNAIAMRISDMSLVDPFGGEKDIKNGRLRFVSDVSAKEDPLRILRGIRFVAKLGFRFDPDSIDQMVENAHLLDTVARERVHDELVRTLAAPHFGKALALAKGVRVLDRVVPHSSDANVVKAAEVKSDDPIVRLAALLHGRDPNEVVNILESLRFSKKDIARVDGLNRVRLLPCDRVGMRHLLAHLVKLPGTLRENVEAAIALVGDHNSDMLRHELDCEPPLTVKDLAVNGNDLIAAGFKGRAIGMFLNDLLELVLNSPDLNEKHTLMAAINCVDPRSVPA